MQSKTQPDFIVEREENSPDEKLVLHTNKIKGLVFDLGGYYSGHADREGLMRYLFKSKKQPSQNLKDATVFLNHGITQKRYALRKFILDRTPEGNDFRRVSRVEIPYMDSPFFNFDKGEWENHSTAVNV